MNAYLLKTIKSAVSADTVEFVETIQSLWSDYGSIDRYRLTGAAVDEIVVKHVRLPQKIQHPLGWNGKRSHQRKLTSYCVETEWYKSWSRYCNDDCRVPYCFAQAQRDDEFLMVLEDLDTSGYSLRKTQPTINDMHSCLQWLANFHAKFMGKLPTGLWPTGTYWHLETRPDELANLPDDEALKAAAPRLDQMLRQTPYQTIVHGDAKLANFCFPTATSDNVAMVDFQYVGGGCGIKDVAYFISSCLNEQDCETMEAILLDNYFESLKHALETWQPAIDPQAVEETWRPLYSIAWTDFYRFLKGWNPEHWKIHGYSERLAREVLKSLNQL
jgi:hypothetical protein